MATVALSMGDGGVTAPSYVRLRLIWRMLINYDVAPPFDCRLHRGLLFGQSDICDYRSYLLLDPACSRMTPYLGTGLLVVSY